MKIKISIMAVTLAAITLFTSACSKIDYSSGVDNESLPLPSFTDDGDSKDDTAPPANITTEHL